MSASLCSIMMLSDILPVCSVYCVATSSFRTVRQSLSHRERYCQFDAVTVTMA